LSQSPDRSLTFSPRQLSQADGFFIYAVKLRSAKGWADVVGLGRLWLVEVIAGWQISVAFQVFRAQGAAQVVFFGKPFSEVHELAPMRTEGAVFFGKPSSGLPAGRTFDLGESAHAHFP